MQITQHANQPPPRRPRKKEKPAPAKEKSTTATPATVLPPETPALVGFAAGPNQPEAPAVAAQGYASARSIVSVR